MGRVAQIIIELVLLLGYTLRMILQDQQHQNWPSQSANLLQDRAMGRPSLIGLNMSCYTGKSDPNHPQYTHGMRNTAEYATWRRMLSRCQNSKNKFYHRYGGRGITVCDEWLQFSNFFKHMGYRPAGTSLDRINNNGNYEPGNCRWASQTVQQNNRASTRIVNAFGINQSIAMWSRLMGINKDTIYHRIKTGWPIETAIATRPNTKKHTPKPEQEQCPPSKTSSAQP